MATVRHQHNISVFCLDFADEPTPEKKKAAKAAAKVILDSMWHFESVINGALKEAGATAKVVMDDNQDGSVTITVRNNYWSND